MSIEIRNISKTFGNFTALRDVSLTVNEGELVALLGPSGSGKTTLLRIIAGLEVPDALLGSEVLFHDRSMTHAGVAERGVGFVFQHYALFRHMTVFENIAFGLRVRPRGMRPSGEDIRERVHKLLGLVQLEGLHNRYPAQLSGGQRQRVALARALAVEPKVLLLDEPFGALDAKVRQELRRWLRRLHDEIHVTSVFVTHDQEEALEVADRIVVMRSGQIEQIGAPEEVFHSPRTAFVMEFLGRVNVFHGRATAGATTAEAVELDGLGQGDEGGGGRARIFVRPHDLEISLEHLSKSSFPGTIEYVSAAGPTVKVEVRTETAGLLSVETGLERRESLQLRVGQRVFVTPRQVKVFPADYSI